MYTSFLKGNFIFLADLEEKEMLLTDDKSSSGQPIDRGQYFGLRETFYHRGTTTDEVCLTDYPDPNELDNCDYILCGIRTRQIFVQSPETMEMLPYITK